MYKVLHISDLHYDSEEKTGGRVDNKAGLDIESSQEKEFFEALKKYLSNNKVNLFVISGDIINGWDRDAQEQFSSKFIELITKDGYDKKNILVVPGNHDVKKGSAISSHDRYHEFLSSWKDCNLPFLDGVYKHSDIVLDEENLLMLIPLNTSNWSQIKINVDEKIKKHIDTLTDEELKKEFERQFTYDAAHISTEQIEYLKEKIKRIKDYEKYNKVLIQHHHISSVDDSIEIKELSDILNLEDLKDFIKEFNIRVLLHGHKHVGRNFYEYFNKNSKPYKLLVSSSSNLNKDSFFQVLEFTDMELKISKFNRRNKQTGSEEFTLFDNVQTDNTIVIEDTDITRLHNKLCTLTKNYSAENKQVICHLNLENKYFSHDNPPIRYLKKKEIQKDFEEAVERYKELWLSDDSIYKNDMPLHGIRYYNHSGFVNQEKSITYEIETNKNTSRAIAILIEPTKDLHNNKSEKTEYPSFISCQFIVRNNEYLDIIANFRTQEMRYWWTLNVNELFELLCRMQDNLKEKYKLGKITTITNKAKQAKENAFGRLHVSRIDYYADRKRTELANLAHSIMCKNSFNSTNELKQKSLISEWEKIFKDLFDFTKIEKNIDGNSKLRNGIKILSDHIEKAKNDSCKNHDIFLKSIKTLIDKIDLIDNSDAKDYSNRMKEFKEELEYTHKAYKNILEELKK